MAEGLDAGARGLERLAHGLGPRAALRTSRPAGVARYLSRPGLANENSKGLGIGVGLVAGYL